jgi:hypothetical protein
MNESCVEPISYSASPARMSPWRKSTADRVVRERCCCTAIASTVARRKGRRFLKTFWHSTHSDPLNVLMKLLSVGFLGRPRSI